LPKSTNAEEEKQQVSPRKARNASPGRPMGFAFAFYEIFD